MQGQDVGFVDGLTWAIRFASDIAFRWIPGTVQVVTGTAPGSQPVSFGDPLTEPVTAPEVVQFLQTASPGAYSELYHNWSILVALSIMVSLLLIAGIIYCIIRILQVRHHEELRFRAAAHPIAARDIPRTQLRWNRIQEQVHSDSEQNWRLAILEADIMLSELLDVQGYRGETMADKMKQVERGDFKTIDLAWEAHKVRNQIAHQGSHLLLNQREARRVIGLYERVFREFKFIE